MNEQNERSRKYFLEKFHGYCKGCGEPCEIITKVKRYSEFNGKPIYSVTFRCPNKRFFFDNHKKEKLRMVNRNELKDLGII